MMKLFTVSVTLHYLQRTEVWTEFVFVLAKTKMDLFKICFRWIYPYLPLPLSTSLFLSPVMAWDLMAKFYCTHQQPKEENTLTLSSLLEEIWCAGTSNSNRLTSTKKHNAFSIKKSLPFRRPPDNEQTFYCLKETAERCPKKALEHSWMTVISS